MTELPGNRETAYRVFAAEFDDATVEHQESDEERAPNYVITPTGARVNRLFAVGVLTEVEAVNDDVLRARIVDPTGAFVVYAGQYQPDEMAALERLDPPEFVAITGKARTFSPDDSDRVYSSIRPESINTVDADTRDRWVVRTAEHTVERVGTLAAAATLDAGGDALRDALEHGGLPAATASGSALALEHYGTTPAYLAGVHDLAVNAARVVAGEIDEAEAYDRAPSDTGDGTASYAGLARDLDVQPAPGAESATPDSASPDADAAPTTDDTTAAAEAGTGAGDAHTAASGSDASTAAAGSDDGESDHEEALEATAEVTAATTESATNASLDGDEADDESIAGDPDDESVAGDASEESIAGAPDDDTATEEAEGLTASEPDGDEGVGDFEPSEGASTGANTDEMYEFDEDEREAIEDEYGTDFASGNDVPDPGESDLDAPDPEDAVVDETTDADAADAAEGEATAETPDSGGADDAADATDDVDESGAGNAADAGTDDAADADGDGAADVELDEYVLETMRELDDGDGVSRDELVERVVADTDASADDVEDALQDALMGGRCYEPDDGVLKPI